jgi:hypothetical protein
MEYMTNFNNSKEKILKKIKSLSGVIKGSVYENVRYCGKENCSCKKNKKPHKSLFLSFRYEGKTKLVPIKKEWVPEIKAKIEEYKELKKAIDELAYINSQDLRNKDKK